jgi:hypothetical protein
MNSTNRALFLVALLAGCQPNNKATDDAGATTTPSATATAALSVPAPSASVVASAQPPAPAASAKGAAYVWSQEAVVEGMLVQKQLEYSPGPVPVVVFDHPITINPKAGDSTPTLANAKEAWLSYNKIDKAAVAKLVGKKVTYRGVLEPMQTAHHYSNPWLDGTVTAR